MDAIDTHTDLSKAIAAVCPIDGIAIISRADRSVRIDYAKTATPQQRADAQAALAAFDWDAPSVAEKRQARVDAARTLLKANMSKLAPEVQALALLLGVE